MSLREMLSDYWYAFQQELFPRLESELGPMGERYELFVAVLELVRVEALLPYFRGQVGRPEEDRAALARAFIAKAVFDIPTTRALIERLEVDGRLCRLCGWSGAGRLPSEATFSRAFPDDGGRRCVCVGLCLGPMVRLRPAPPPMGGHLAETAETFVHGLCQALMKRGVPRSLMTDNGSPMTAGEVEQGLHRLGIVHATTLAYAPYQNGKMEVLWSSVKGRLMAMLEGVEALNLHVGLKRRLPVGAGRNRTHHGGGSPRHHAPLEPLDPFLPLRGGAPRPMPRTSVRVMISFASASWGAGGESDGTPDQ